MRPEIIPYVVVSNIGIFVLIGIIILAICFAVDPHIYRKPFFLYILYTVSAITGVLVLVAIFNWWSILSKL